MQDAHERAFAALHDGDDLALAALLGALLLGFSHGHADGIAMQGAAGLGGFHVDILVLSFDAHEHEALAGHHGPALELGNYLDFLLAGCRLSFASSFSSTHIIQIYGRKVTYNFFIFVS